MVMTFLMRGAPSIIVALVAVAFLTTKTFHVERVIAIDEAILWEILSDTERYHEWNPVFVGVDGAYEEGASLTNTVRFPTGALVEMPAQVKTVTPLREVHQHGGTPGVITFDHQWLLEPVEGGTRVIQHELDRGIYLWFWDSSRLSQPTQRYSTHSKRAPLKWPPAEATDRHSLS